MRQIIAYALLLSSMIFATYVFADETANYTQKTLPNGDVETVVTMPDGSKMVQIKHKDGTIDTNMNQLNNDSH